MLGELPHAELELIYSALLAETQQQHRPVYKGIYSDWSVEEEDVREVVAYRAGLNVAALGEALQNEHNFKQLVYVDKPALACSPACGDGNCADISRSSSRRLAEWRCCSWSCRSWSLAVPCTHVCHANQALHSGQLYVHWLH